MVLLSTYMTSFRRSLMTAQNQEPKETIITEKIEKKENERFEIRSETFNAFFLISKMVHR